MAAITRFFHGMGKLPGFVCSLIPVSCDVLAGQGLQCHCFAHLVSPKVPQRELGAGQATDRALLPLLLYSGTKEFFGTLLPAALERLESCIPPQPHAV